MKKRLLAFFLAFTMVFSIVPVTAFAAETKEPVGPFTEIVTDTGADVTAKFVAMVPAVTDWATYNDGPYYHVTVPAGTESVLVTYPESVSILGSPSAYSYSLSVPDYTLGYGSEQFAVTENEDGSHTVTIPVANYLLAEDGTGTGMSLEDSSTYDPITFFTFAYAQESVSHSVTLTAGEGYTLTGKATVEDGKDYSFTVTIADDYEMEDNFVVKANGETLTAGESGSYTVENVTADLTITVEGVVKKQAASHSVTLTSGGGYTLKGETTVADGADYTFSLKFDNYYGAGNGFAVKANGTALTAGEDGTYTVKNVTADLTITVEGVARLYKVFLPHGWSRQFTMSACDGYADPSTDPRIAKGGDYKFKVTPNVGFAVRDNNYDVSFSGAGTVSVEVKDGYAVVTLTDIFSNGDVRIQGVKEIITVTLPNGEGFTAAAAEGTKTPVLKGDSYSFTVAANEGYDATNMVVKVNGNEVAGTDGSYTVENVSSDLTITVEGVKKIAYTLNFTGMSGVGNNVALNGAFEGVFSISADCDAPYKTFAAAFKFDPAVVSVTYVRPAIFQQSVDTENGILTLTSKDSSFPANQKGEIMIGFKSIAFGDATVTLTSAKVNDKEVLSAPIALAKAAGYKVSWTEDKAYTITGEKYADVNGTYTFTVAANEGYDGTNMVVKVNDAEVTAVDGKYTVEKVSSDLTITVEGVKKIVTGLKALSFGSTGTRSSAKTFTLSPAFDPAVKEYTLLVPDTTNVVYVWATRGADLTSKAKITAAWTSMSTGKASTTTITSGSSSGKGLSGFNIVSAESNTLTITVTEGDVTDVYTVKTVRIDPSLTKLSLDGVKINETFVSTKKAYAAITTKNSVTVLATPRSESYTVTYNGGASNVIPLSAGDNTIEIVVTNKDGYTNSYTLTVTKADHNVTIPTDESCIITGKEAVMDGADYTFKVEVDYRYEAGEDFAVEVNGETVTGEDGVYTVKNVTTDLVITVKGVTKKILKPVTVYFSFSHDDTFESCEQSGQVMALKEVTVPYFDLALYGLENFYFASEDYGPASGDPTGGPGSALDPGTKEFAYGKITMLHLFLYATEVYYLGIDPADAGKGYLADNGMGTDIFNYSGSTGSIFLQNIWNYDLNLNYYLNYEYPLASAGWGSTCDQILLRDGDIVTLGHFSDYSFFNDTTSIFNYIVADKTDPVQGDKIKLELYHAGADMYGTYNTAHTLIDYSPSVYCTPVNGIVSGDVTTWQYVGNAEADGSLVVDTSTLAPGEYIFALAGQPGKENPGAICSTPGGIRLTIHEKPAVKGDIDGDGVIDVNDVMALSGAINSGDDLDAAIADINGDGVVDTFDVMALYEIIKSND